MFTLCVERPPLCPSIGDEQPIRPPNDESWAVHRAAATKPHKLPSKGTANSSNTTAPIFPLQGVKLSEERSSVATDLCRHGVVSPQWIRIDKQSKRARAKTKARPSLGNVSHTNGPRRTACYDKESVIVKSQTERVKVTLNWRWRWQGRAKHNRWRHQSILIRHQCLPKDRKCKRGHHETACVSETSDPVSRKHKTAALPASLRLLSFPERASVRCDANARVKISIWLVRLLFVDTAGIRSSPWTCNSVKVDVKFHLEASFIFLVYNLVILATIAFNERPSPLSSHEPKWRS